MAASFETLGNASLLFHENGRPVLGTDPWLVGTCYYGSWGLDRELSEAELAGMRSAEYLWFSHGHPDHLHAESLPLLSRSQKILLPDHYLPDIANWLRSEGFSVEVLAYRQWKRLSPGIRCMCMDNENQDGVLIVESAGSLVVNLNDSPLCGEKQFIAGLVRQYPREKTYLAKLCAFDADMINIVNRDGERVIGPPEERKFGTVWSTARVAEQLGVGSFVSSSSQHIYLRSDSAWANPYRVTWADIQRHWPRPAIGIIEPFVSIDLETGAVTAKHPAQTSDFSRVTDSTGDDDVTETLTAEDWSQIEHFFKQFKLLPFDHVDIQVGGERRRIWLDATQMGKPEEKLTGFAFRCPRKSLMAAVSSSYFGDLFIGNFMMTELHNATLWPDFTPVVAMLGSNARVYTKPELRKYKQRYFRRNRAGYVQAKIEDLVQVRAVNLIRHVSERVGVKGPLKRVYRRMLGDRKAA
jgi:hypothetical protein